ncbi:MAG: hypothetical protein ACKVU1_16205 [bacterium]
MRARAGGGFTMTNTQRALRRIAAAATLVLGIAGCGGDKTTDPQPITDAEGVLYNFAGKPTSAGYSGDGTAAVGARLYFPQDVVVSGSDAYIADWNNHVIRKVDANGIISRAMGSGVHGDDSDGPALEVSLNHPVNVAISPAGDFYISVWHNWKVKKVDKTTRMVTSVVGSDNGFAGDNGPALDALISLPSCVVWDPAGNMYISDQGNTRIRRIDTQGIITTFAGSTGGYADGVGEAAQFNWSTGTNAYPGGKMDVSADGNDIFVADTQNHRIRKINIATRAVTTIAGNGTPGYTGDGGPALSAQFSQPTDIACTPAGSVYVADSDNAVIRKIDANGVVTTVAGSGERGYSVDATRAIDAALYKPSGIYWDDATSTLYIADSYNHQVKRVKLPR